MSTALHPGHEERSLGDLLSDLANQLLALFRHEIALAQAELGEKATRVGRNVGMLAAGAFVAYAGFLAIVAGLVILAAEVMPLWMAALLVGALVAGAGFLLIQVGLSTLRTLDLTPRQTIRTLEDDLRWAKEQTR